MYKKLIQAWLLVGTLDIIGATINYLLHGGKSLTVIPKYIATALVGKEIANSRAGIALLGLALHYLIAFVFTFIFFKFYKSLSNAIPNKWLLGIFYGMVIWCVMNLGVLPLSQLQTSISNIKFNSAAIGIGILIVCVGMPLSLLCGKHRN